MLTGTVYASHPRYQTDFGLRREVIDDAHPFNHVNAGVDLMTKIEGQPLLLIISDRGAQIAMERIHDIGHLYHCRRIASSTNFEECLAKSQRHLPGYPVHPCNYHCDMETTETKLNPCQCSFGQ